MSITVEELYASPAHYLHSFEGETALFVPMDRAAYNRSIFLDQRISAAGGGVLRVPISMLLGSAPEPASIGWIFHIAHCGSTLLARALDDVSLNLVLREPLALRQVALSGDATRLHLVRAMLSKCYRNDAPTIVKANVPVNFILPDLIAGREPPRAIFLHYALRDYVLAILRDDKHRNWLNNVTSQIASRLSTTAQASDAERVAALWHAQMRAFAAAIGRLPEARSLDAEDFFADPFDVIRKAARHLQVPVADSLIRQKVDGALFATYSKNPELAFDNQARLDRRRALEDHLADEVAQAQAWVDRAQEPADTSLAVILAANLLS